MNRIITARALPATLAAAVVLLASCTSDGQTGTDPAGNGETPTRSTAQPDYEVLPNWDVGRRILAGRWAVAAAGGNEAPLAVIDVPENFDGGGPFIWNNRGVIGYHAVDGVYEEPCSASGTTSTVGATAEDVAAALAAQKLTTTSKPVPVSVGGYDGLYLKLTTPADLDYKTCVEDTLHIWKSGDDLGRDLGEPVVDRYWILDVDGSLLILSALVFGTGEGKRVQLFSGLVETATFVEPT